MKINEGAEAKREILRDACVHFQTNFEKVIDLTNTVHDQIELLVGERARAHEIVETDRLRVIELLNAYFLVAHEGIETICIYIHHI